MARSYQVELISRHKRLKPTTHTFSSKRSADEFIKQVKDTRHHPWKGWPVGQITLRYPGGDRQQAWMLAETPAKAAA